MFIYDISIRAYIMTDNKSESIGDVKSQYRKDNNKFIIGERNRSYEIQSLKKRNT